MILLLRGVSFPHPNLGHSERGAQAIFRLAVMMPTISQEEVALITDEWNVYIAGAVDTDCAEEILDHYGRNGFQEKSHYSILHKLVKSLMVMQMYNEVFPQIRSQSLQIGPIQVM